MKTTHRLSIAAFVLAIFNVFVATVQAQFNYVVTNGTVTITGYTGPGGDVTIPSTIDGLPVTTIGERAFAGTWDMPNTKLTGAVIPISVSTIGVAAFSWCTSLTSATIGNSVTSIGFQAFYYCTSLTSVTIPDSVTSIGWQAFDHCTSLTSVTIPDSVTSIGWEVFSWCTGLTSVTIGNSVTSIVVGAFGMCTSLISVTIPDSVTSIGNGAFRYCTSLTSVTIPDSVTSIGVDAFSGCTNLGGVYFHGGTPSFSAEYPPFSGANEVISYYLPGTTGWTNTYAGRPTAPWLLPYPMILTTTPNFGIQTNAFAFRISWATNIPVVIESATTLANPVWSAVSTNTLTDGWSYFRDVEWTNHPARFYRVRQW